MGQLRKNRGETHAVDHAVAIFGIAVVIAKNRLETIFAGLQDDAPGQFARHGRIETQAHGADRQARRLCVFTLAIEAGGKRLAHGVVEGFFDRIGDAARQGRVARRGHPFAVHEADRRRRRKAAVAGQCDKTQGCFFSGFVQALGLQQLKPLFAFDQTHGDAFTQAIHRAPHIGLHTRQRGRAVEPQGKKLLLVNSAAGVGLDALDERPSTIEFIAGYACQFCPSGRFDA